MSLLRFFKPKNGLPNPTEALSTSVPFAAIAQANGGVLKAISNDKQKREPYKKYSAGLRAEIGSIADAITACACKKISVLHFSLNKLSWVPWTNENNFCTKDFYAKISQHENLQIYGNALPYKDKDKFLL